MVPDKAGAAFKAVVKEMLPERLHEMSKYKEYLNTQHVYLRNFDIHSYTDAFMQDL